jgi:hypothetical protein
MSTVSNLRAAKVGDEVVYYGRHHKKVSRVVKVKPPGVWLADETRWTMDGKRWGDGRAYSRDQAHLITDREAFYVSLEAENRRQEMLKDRESLIGYAIPREFAYRYLDDMEVLAIRSYLAKARSRQAADIIIRFAAVLARD